MTSMSLGIQLKGSNALLQVLSLFSRKKKESVKNGSCDKKKKNLVIFGIFDCLDPVIRELIGLLLLGGG